MTHGLPNHTRYFTIPSPLGDMQHGVCALKDGSSSPHIFFRTESLYEAVTVCNWLNERPAAAIVNVLTTYPTFNMELTRVGSKIVEDYKRPTDVKIVSGNEPYGGETIWHRMILCKNDLIEADDFWRMFRKHTRPGAVYTYWGMGRGSTDLRVVLDKEDE